MDRNDLIDHPTFCIFPWVHRVIDTNGHTRICCRERGDLDKRVKHLKRDWNGDDMKNLRSQLMNGECPSRCGDCWEQEVAGKTSHRQIYTRQWLENDGIISLINRSIENGFHVDQPPIHVEVRFGNLCNLSCKMCIGGSSSQVFKDSAKLKVLDPGGYAEHIPHEDQYLTQDFLWYEQWENWEQVDRLIPHLQHLTITGGEPTLIKKNIEFLKRIILLGYAPKIHVDITTNLTNINTDFLDLIGKFKSFHITFSLDGVGDFYEYIRYPANWDTIETNMRKVLERTKVYPNLMVGTNVVVQAFNVMYLPELIDTMMGILSEECASFPGNVSQLSLTPINHPLSFDLSGLPDIVKTVALYKIERWREQNTYSEEEMALIPDGALDMICNQLKQPENPGRAKKLLDYCRFIDQNKRVTMQQKIPELARLLDVSVQ